MQEAFTSNLKVRFEGDQIYTYIGEVLVSVNPYKDTGIYTDEVLKSYNGKKLYQVHDYQRRSRLNHRTG